MADSDDEYVQDASSDDADLSMTGIGINSASGPSSKPQSHATGAQASDRLGKKAVSKRKVAGQARWEASAQNLGLTEGADGSITGVLERDLEAQKRQSKEGAPSGHQPDEQLSQPNSRPLRWVDTYNQGLKAADEFQYEEKALLTTDAQYLHNPKLRELEPKDARLEAPLRRRISRLNSLDYTLPPTELMNSYSRLKKDTTPLQRGIIRHVVLVLDLSDAMLDNDLKPNRHVLLLRYVLVYIQEFFEQNPISQLAIVGMRSGLAKPVSDLSGNPNQHITAVKQLLEKQEPQGDPSLQNALEMSNAMLAGTPSHGTREVVIVFGALRSIDPGDIYVTIRRCAKERLRVSIIGLGARVHICGEIVERTNGGDKTGYAVAVDETSLKELLTATTTPPVIREGADHGLSALASLLKMGFPSRIAEDTPSLCACHNKLGKGGYQCPQCMLKVCTLPVVCPGCDLTLILSTHLARSYHHLFPLRTWVEVSWRRARELGTTSCASCQDEFREIPEGAGLDENEDTMMTGTDEASKGKAAQKQQEPKTGEGASESGRYECEVCQNHFCINCDVFCHDVLHNCPGCLSQAHLPGLKAL
ncbi:MAG: hypothetical protein M1820_010191 [Bogoriella megaspora]|nr:MAG: hypothetical protein M1820_010191 [Bogoriella megaspora]